MTVVQSSRCSREFTRLKRTQREQAIKDAVADGRLDARRYDSYCHMFAGDAA